MTALVLGPDQVEALAALRAHAETPENRYRLSDLVCVIKGAIPTVGDDPSMVVRIPVGFRVVYSVEQHPSGWIRHMSVSLDGGSKVPGLHAVARSAKQLGFSVGEDLRFDLARHQIHEDQVFGLAVPNVFERMEVEGG